MNDENISFEADHLAGVDTPQSTTELFGHGELFSRLIKQFEQNLLPGAILLHGQKGIGKATFAFVLTRQILLAGGDESEERTTQQLANGAHPNVSVLRRVKRERGVGFYQNIRIDEVRKVTANLQQTRGRAGRRIVIIDAVDDCNINAANALLKTLEEPPEETHLILISHRPGALLPTIRSRCQACQMRPIANEHMKIILQKSGKSEQEISTAIALAGGRPRRGFEALGLQNGSVLSEMSDWLADVKTSTLAASGNSARLTAAKLKICETLANKKYQLEAEFAREMLLDWIADEAKMLAVLGAAVAGESENAQSKVRLASANLLWEKANKLFINADTYNLDLRQSFLILLDDISNHAQLTAATPV